MRRCRPTKAESRLLIPDTSRPISKPESAIRNRSSPIPNRITPPAPSASRNELPV